MQIQKKMYKGLLSAILANREMIVSVNGAEKFRTRSPIKDVKACPQIEKSIELLVHSSDRINQRRQGMNSFFWLVNALLLTGQGALVKLILCGETKHVWAPFAICVLVGLIGLIGMQVCSFWRRFINNYRIVSRSKVILLQVLEEEHPIQLYTTQYEIMRKNDYEIQTALEIETVQFIRKIHYCVCVFFFLAGMLQLLSLASRL